MLSTVSFGSGSKPPRPAPSSPTSAAFAGLDDELHDARRVLSQGQEEDLRYALNRVLNKVEELSSLLKTAVKAQTELETQLNLAKSNLQLVMSNNEMLEEALRRETPCSAREVGWRRWSAREVQNHNAANKSEDRPRSLDYGPLNGSGKPTVPSVAAPAPANGTTSTPSTPSIPQPTPPTSTQESRFFGFRFSSGSTRPATLSPHPSHLTSPSLSSLVPNAREKVLEDLQERLELERQAHKTADAARAALEAELESLSQALFEEANKMVATERMKRAETEEELNQAQLEKDALRRALDLVEQENEQLRSANISSPPASGRTNQSDSLSQSPVVLPLRLSPTLPSSRPPSRISTGKMTPPVASSNEMISYHTDLVLEPALDPSQAGLHRRAVSMEKLGPTELSVDVLKETLPVIAPSPSAPFLPNEPSPWADGAS